MRKKILKNIDWGVFVCSIILCFIGMVALFSATQESGYYDLEKQFIWFLVSMPIIFALIFIDYETIAKISPIFYRNFYCTINSSSFYRTYKWCYKLVWFKIFCFSTSRICKNICYINFIICDMQNTTFRKKWNK